MKLISIVTPCYNEEGSVRALHEQIKDVFSKLPGYVYEHICIDNASKDNTVKILRELAKEDKKLKVIINSRNFGHIRSPYYGLLQASGDAVILMASDLQDPPSLIPAFIKKWEDGYKIALGVKNTSDESALMFFIRKTYYNLVGYLSEIPLIKNATGFGLYDRAVIDIIRTIEDPYPYFRGLICDIGFEQAHIIYHQTRRSRGITKNNFYTLYDIAMLGLTNHSKIPLRLATILGFSFSALSMFVSLGYLIAKLAFWSRFVLGTAPVLIGLFMFSSVQLFFIGIVGEYIGAIHTQVLKRPIVIEKERINF